MDDPWGSPWAEDDSIAPPAINTAELKAPGTPETSPQFNRDSKSPWDDAVEFGEWASLPDTEDLAVVVTEAAHDATSENGDVPFNEESVQGTGEGSDDSRLGWHDGDENPFGSNYASLQASNPSARQSSLGPWLMKDSKDDKIVGKPGTGRLSHRERSLSKDDITSESAKDLSNWDLEDQPRVQPVRTGFRAPIITEIETPLHNQAISLQEPDSPITAEEESVLRDRNAQDTVNGELSVSRPSSSPSDKSHHEEVLAESPRTSFEDEEKQPKAAGNAPLITKPVTTDKSHDTGRDARLQDELVVTFRRSRTEDDIGDLEESSSNIVVREGLQKQTENKDPISSLLQSMSYDTSPLPNEMRESSAGLSSISVDIHESVVFRPDLLKICQLFGEEPIGPIPSHLMLDEIPDWDISRNSFSSTEQRKIWYRISRFGPMRKHNTGDEDNYLRINWKDSNVRKDTLRIVARWREEDISGGVILGGGGKPASIFGWGQKNAAPMSIAAALASKRGSPAIGAEHPTFEIFPKNLDAVPSSMQDYPQNSTEPIFSSKDTKKSPTLGITPQFSWSTGMPASAMAESDWNRLFPPEAPNQKILQSETLQAPRTISSAESKELITASATNSVKDNVNTAQQPPLAVILTPALGVGPVSVTALPTDATTFMKDEDDDWGEMVSTPSLAASSSIASTRTAHEPLSSLTEIVGSTSGSDFAPVEQAREVKTHLNEVNFTSHFESSMSVASASKKPPNKNSIGKPMSPVADAWSATDFSFFDAPLAQHLPMIPQPTPQMVKETHKPEEILTHSQGESKEEMEQIRIVKNIVKSLPDLSYMLRR